MGWTIEIVSVKSYLATTIVVLPLYFPFEKVKNEMLLSKKKMTIRCNSILLVRTFLFWLPLHFIKGCVTSIYGYGLPAGICMNLLLTFSSALIFVSVQSSTFSNPTESVFLIQHRVHITCCRYHMHMIFVTGR